jgi:hypothetical protein
MAKKRKTWTWSADRHRRHREKKAAMQALQQGAVTANGPETIDILVNDVLRNAPLNELVRCQIRTQVTTYYVPVAKDA